MVEQRTVFILLLILCFAVVFISEIGTVKAESTIYIRADGRVEGTDKIQRDGNIYKLTENIVGTVTIKKDDIIFDGDWHIIQDYSDGGYYVLTLSQVNNVTVKNVIIKGIRSGIGLIDTTNSTVIDNVVSKKQFLIDFHFGIACFDDCQDNLISGNSVTNFSKGIYFRRNCRYSHTIIGNNITSCHMGIQIMMGHEGDENGNIITGNHIANNTWGIVTQWYGDNYYVWKPNPFEMNNIIYKNNFINNSQNFLSGHLIYDPDSANIWDNISIGNYWSDYNGTDSDGDGIGDTPYIMDENNQDNYPLMNPVDIEVATVLFFQPPEIYLSSPENRTYTVNCVSLNFTVNEVTTWMGYSLDGQNNITITENTLNVAELSDGSHSLIVYANDTTGDTGKSETICFTINTFSTICVIGIILTIALVGAAFLAYFLKIKKTTRPK
jgi:hypothetical protein